VTLADDRQLVSTSALQRRAAFRISIEVPVWIEFPVERDCELVDISVLGARMNVQLPVEIGGVCEFLLVTEDYGTLPITAEVVRAAGGETAVRFVGVPHTAARAIKEIIVGEQRRQLKKRIDVA
jgi:hypothetical protein